MSKQFILAFIILFGLMFLLSPEKCFADTAALFEQAETYTRNGCTQQAREIYDSIVTDYPATGHALKAQAELIILSIHKKADSEIQHQIDGLIAGYSEHTTLPTALCIIAKGYAWAGRLQQGKALYQQIIQDYPDNPAVSEAQIGISRTDILSLIEAGNYTTAADEVNKLITDHSSSEYLPGTLYHIARCYQWAREFDHAKSVLQRIMQVYPQSPQAARAQFYIERADILSLIKSGNYTQASAKLEQFKQSFATDLTLAVALFHFAQEYERQAKYENAKDLHQQVIQQYPDTPRAERARFDYPRTNILYLIQAADFTTVESQLDKFKADFSSHSKLTKAMFNIGEEYYKQAVRQEADGLETQAKELYTKATSVWQTVLQDPQSYAFTADAYYFSGQCHHKLDQHQQTINCCQPVAESWPNYQYASDALFLVGNSYEKLLKAGQIAELQAVSQIRAAYTQILENHPAHPAAKYAQYWLSKNTAR